MRTATPKLRYLALAYRYRALAYSESGRISWPRDRQTLLRREVSRELRPLLLEDGPNERDEELRAILRMEPSNDLRRDRRRIEAPAVTLCVVEENRRIAAVAVVLHRHEQRVAG